MLGALAWLLAGCGPEQSPDEQLIRAIRQKDLAEVERLLEAGANPNADQVPGFEGRPPLFHAATFGYTDIAQELIDKGVIVPEGHKRFLLVGSRPVAPARELDPAVFTRLDRRTDRTIVLPEGEYRIISRHSPALTAAEVTKKGTLVGALSIEEPERFWNGSRFLILMKS